MADSDKAGSKKSGSDKDGNIIQFNNLNILGKAVFVSGVLTRAATKIVDSTIQATVEIVTEAEKAFKQGLDSNIEEAKIIEEHEDQSRAAKKKKTQT